MDKVRNDTPTRLSPTKTDKIPTAWQAMFIQASLGSLSSYAKVLLYLEAPPLLSPVIWDLLYKITSAKSYWAECTSIRLIHKTF